MLKKCDNQHEIPFFSRYCPFCGNMVKQYDYYYMEGANLYRNSTLARPIKYNFKDLLTVISLDQGGNVHPDQLPGLSGAGNLVLLPQFLTQQFHIYDLERKQILSSFPSTGELKLATTPVFDGMFFNIICKNILHRIGVKRDLSPIHTVYEFSSLTNLPKAVSPLLFSKETNIYLIFTAGSKLFILDISKFNSEHKIQEVALPELQDNDEYLPIIKANINDDLFYLLTRRGKVYRMALNYTNQPHHKISPLLDYNEKYEIKEITYPIILNGVKNKYLYFLAKGDNNKVFLSGINLSNENDFIKKTGIVWQDNVIKNEFLMNDGLRLIIKDSIYSQNISFASEMSVTKDIPIGFELNQDNFFILNDVIYSLSIMDQQIYKYNLRQNQQLPSIPLTRTIGQQIIPIKKMIYVSGMIVIMTIDKVHFLLDL